MRDEKRAADLSRLEAISVDVQRAVLAMRYCAAAMLAGLAPRPRGHTFTRFGRKGADPFASGFFAGLKGCGTVRGT